MHLECTVQQHPYYPPKSEVGEEGYEEGTLASVAMNSNDAIIDKPDPRNETNTYESVPCGTLVQVEHKAWVKVLHIHTHTHTCVRSTSKHKYKLN